MILKSGDKTSQDKLLLVLRQTEKERMKWWWRNDKNGRITAPCRQFIDFNWVREGKSAANPHQGRSQSRNREVNSKLGV